MPNKYTVSKHTRQNWLIDAGLLISAVIASLSGIYFLLFPNAGYQGGRNPFYDLVILFTRHTWGDIHAWSGLTMVAAAAIHIPWHWHWIASMAKKIAAVISGKAAPMNRRGRFNLYLNLTVGASFLLTAISGIYFWLVPEAAHGSSASVTAFLFTNLTWDLIHTWSGILLIAAAVLHFAIHWKWVTKITRSIFTPQNLSAGQTKRSINTESQAR